MRPVSGFEPVGFPPAVGRPGRAGVRAGLGRVRRGRADHRRMREGVRNHGLDHLRVKHAAHRLGMDPVTPQQVGVILDRRVPVDHENVRILAGRGRDRRIHLMLPGTGHERIDQDQPAVADNVSDLPDLGWGNGPVGAKSDDHDGPQLAVGGVLPDYRHTGIHLPADHGVDGDAGQRVLQLRSGGEHHRIAYRHHLRARDHRRLRGRRVRRYGPGAARGAWRLRPLCRRGP